MLLGHEPPLCPSSLRLAGTPRGRGERGTAGCAVGRTAVWRPSEAGGPWPGLEVRWKVPGCKHRLRWPAVGDPAAPTAFPKPAAQVFMALIRCALPGVGSTQKRLAHMPVLVTPPWPPVKVTRISLAVDPLRELQALVWVRLVPLVTAGQEGGAVRAEGLSRGAGVGWGVGALHSRASAPGSAGGKQVPWAAWSRHRQWSLLCQGDKCTLSNGLPLMVLQHL